MNNKKTIWMLIIGVVIVVLAVALALAGKKGVNNLNNTNGESNSALFDENATPQSVVPVPETIDWKKEAGANFKVEFMNDEEKQAMGISTSTRVQVLARDKDTNVVLAYKVINADADIINNLEQ